MNAIRSTFSVFIAFLIDGLCFTSWRVLSQKA